MSVDTGGADLGPHRHETDIRALEIRSRQRIDALKVITTGVVVTLIPAILGWLIQNQEVEIERIKSEQGYLSEFADKALQDDLQKRYSFADYLATVAISKESRNRWNEYREKIKLLFDKQDEIKVRIVDIKGKIDEENKKLMNADKEKIANYRYELANAEAELKQLRDDFNLLNAPVIAPSSDIFTEEYGGGTGMRFQVRNLNLGEQGNAIWLKQGGEINSTIELKQDCGECGEFAQNQILIGIAGENVAQACVWSGQQKSDGWQPASFSLKVPNIAGTYYVRTRYAQAHTCDEASLNWWLVDRPEGPTSASDIGVIVVSRSPSGG